MNTEQTEPQSEVQPVTTQLSEQAEQAAPVMVPQIKLQPKHNCRKCYGTGRIGYVNGDLNNPLICQCVINSAKKLKLHQWQDKAKAETKISEGQAVETKADDKTKEATT